MISPFKGCLYNMVKIGISEVQDGVSQFKTALVSVASAFDCICLYMVGLAGPCRGNHYSAL